MINRTKINNSIYDILSEDPKNIKQYIEDQSKKTTEQLEKEKEKRNAQSNIVDINLQENLSNQEVNPANQVIVHTLDDNLTHNYFHYFSLYWDAGDPLSSAILRIPKTDTGNTQYWIKYIGEVDILLGNDIEREIRQNTNESNKNVTNETYWSIQGMRPVFKGDIGRIKEYQEELEIHIDSIGKRFKQKIPDEFRQAFINGQNVRDAFQAICEFLGVKYICPPSQTPTQDEEETTESASTDGTENNVDQKTEQEKQLASAASEVADKAKAQASENGETTDGTTDTTETPIEDTSQSDIQNGYADVSFDANGAIVHGSVVVETSPDMAQTLIALEEHPLDKYLEDTTYVATDVQKFLNGEYFPTIHGNILDYGAITIEPTSASSSDVSEISDSTTGDVNGDGVVDSADTAVQYGRDMLSQGRTGITLSGITLTGGTGSGGKQALSYDEVNRMTPLQARNEMTKTNQYYNTTILRLRARARGYVVGSGTPYSQFANG